MSRGVLSRNGLTLMGVYYMYTTGESNEARANVLDVSALSSKHLICTCFFAWNLFLRFVLLKKNKDALLTCMF